MSLSFSNPPSLLHYDDGDRQLLLRPSRVADTVAIVEALQESLAELRQFMPWAHYPQTEEVQGERLTELEANRGSSRDLVFHLYNREGGRFIGCIGLHGARVLNPKAFEIGYWVRTSEAGKGITTLATKCVAVLGFEYFGVERIQCGFNEANVGSARVNQKAGFSKEARLRNFELQPSEAMKANGCNIQPYMLMTALFPEDRDRLNWYPSVCASLSVFDGQGSLVVPDNSSL